MSAAAIAKLAQLWEQLTFARITRTVGRIPEDVLTMEVEKSPGITDYYVRSNRLSDVPESVRNHVRISWRHYFGFAENDSYAGADAVYFNNDANRQLDYDIEMTLTFGTWGNHRPDRFQRPADSTLICGVLEDSPKGPRFKHWFICDEEFLTLVRLIRGEIQPDSDMKAQLTRPGHRDRRDLYWAIARLVMLDNVELFAEKHLENKARDFWFIPKSEDILFIGPGYSEFVHALSYTLEQPQWWQKFLELTGEVEDPEMADHYFDMDQMMGVESPQRPGIVEHSMQCWACEPMRQRLFEREEAKVAAWNASRTPGK